MNQPASSFEKSRTKPVPAAPSGKAATGTRSRKDPRLPAASATPGPDPLPVVLPPGQFKVVMDALRRERDTEMRMYAAPDPELLAAAAHLLRRQIGGWVPCALVECEGTAPLRLTADLASSIYVRFFDHGALSLADASRHADDRQP